MPRARITTQGRRSLKKMIRALQIIVVLTIVNSFACSQSIENTVSTLPVLEVTSTSTNLASVSYQGIPLPLSNEQKQFGGPPPAWLVFNEQAFPGRNAASETLQAHLDPAEAFPDLATISIPEQTEFIVIIASDSVTEFRASVIQWDPQANPLPIIETQGQLLTHTIQTENEFSIFTLIAIYPSKEQFLHIYITFSQMSSVDDVAGYAHYLWRITLDS